ncbi:MAG: signal recognition particle-docking protein FtsY [Ignavibacteria bacterium]|nr:signal recognition particle-docking protein FtsY [Ignavibacteria bacterium]
MGFGNVFEKFRSGLTKTRDSFVGKVQRIVTAKSTIDQEMIDDLEEVLIGSDVGVEATGVIIERIQRRVKEEKYTSPTELTNLLRDEIANVLRGESPQDRGGVIVNEGQRPFVVMIVGVNGVGKTTTIGKMANHFREEGLRVLIGAADTFRAAANEQLEVWARKAHVDIVQQRRGADPAAVAFDTVASAKARNLDVVIIDTAGRLHTKTNLMEELKKIKRVLEKQTPGAPHETLLVLDATTGQNGLQQVRQFADAIGLTGIVLTKLDGTAKGGIVLAIARELKVPVKYVGVGEKIDDLQPFDARAYVDAMFDGRSSSLS